MGAADTSSTVYDLTVGIITRAINGPNVIRELAGVPKLTAGLAATAREVVEARGGVDGVTMRVSATLPSTSLFSPPPRAAPFLPPP
jgi:hypothetical protein